jgi:glutamate synthase (ferredoxin)
MLSDWRNQVSHFIKVMPTEYKTALEKIVKEKKLINRLK